MYSIIRLMFKYRSSK